jgi:tetratricopeptide (TPR) repeat protein
MTLRATAALAVALTAGGAEASSQESAVLRPPPSRETIVLTTGRAITAEHAWFEAGELRYLRDGILYALPRHLVSRVVAEGGGEPLLDPDVHRSRERIAAGDATEALRLARLALFRDPASLPALQALAAAQLALGDPVRARESAEAALSAAPRNARSLELLGDALADLGDFPGARERLADSLALAPDPRVRAKLDALVAMPPPSSRARFLLRYDGAADEPLGVAVLRELDRAFADHEARLGFSPSQPIEVVLQTAAAFRDTTRAPEWVAAWNDGAIRVPVAGLAAPTPGLVRVLRHELVHSFLTFRVGGACPTWLQEGLAQWLSGSDASREDAMLAARRDALPRLESLEKPFTDLSEQQATLAYATSVSAVAYLARTRGEPALRGLIDALAEGRPAAEALPAGAGLSYGELQRDWEKAVRAAASAASR